MISQGFHIGERDWYVMCYYDVHTEEELGEVYKTLLASGCPDFKAREACMVLSRRNTGFTFTNFKDHLSVVFVGESTDAGQAYDTVQHELRHVTDHICEYYDVDPTSEEASYLQGEIARNMFTATSMLFCPRCKNRN